MAGMALVRFSNLGESRFASGGDAFAASASAHRPDPIILSTPSKRQLEQSSGEKRIRPFAKYGKTVRMVDILVSRGDD